MPIFLLHTFLRYALIRYQQSLCLLIPGAFHRNSFAVFVNRLDVCGLLGQAYSGECLDLICGFESQHYTVFCCLAFFYAGRGSDNTEIFAFDFGKIKQQGYIIRCNIFSWIIA